MSSARRGSTATPSRDSTHRTAITAYPVTPGSVAPVGNRVLAYALDGLIALAAVAIGVVVTTEVAPSTSSVSALLLPALLGLVVVVGQWVAESLSGITLGNAVTGIRTVSAATGRPAGPVPILVRHLVITAGALVLLVGQWVVVSSGAFDRSPAQRGWHDKAAGTLVLRAEDVRRAAGGTSTVEAWDSAVARAVAHEPLSPGREQRAPVAGPSTAAASRPAPAPAPAPVTMRAPLTAPVAVPAPSPVIARQPAAVSVPVPAPAPTMTGTAPVTAPVTGPAPVLAPAPATSPVPLTAPTPAAPLIVGPPGVAPDHRAASAPPPVIDAPPRTSAVGRGLGADPSTSGPGVRLRFDTGEVLDVTGDGLVGRRPTAETGTEHVVAIDDPDRSISRVHLAFGVEPGGARLWVVDRGSTNGTVLVRPDGARAALPPGTRAVVEVGWSVRFGRRSLDVLAR